MFRENMTADERLREHYRLAQMHARDVKWDVRTAAPELRAQMATYHIAAALLMAIREQTEAIRSTQPEPGRSTSLPSSQ